MVKGIDFADPTYSVETSQQYIFDWLNAGVAAAVAVANRLRVTNFDLVNDKLRLMLTNHVLSQTSTSDIHDLPVSSTSQNTISISKSESNIGADSTATALAGDRTGSLNAGDESSDPTGVPSNGGLSATMPVAADWQPSTTQPATALVGASGSGSWSVNFAAEPPLSNAFTTGGSNTPTPQAARGQARRPPRIGRPDPPRRRKGQHEE